MRSNRFFTTGFLLVCSLLVLITNINTSPISSRIDEANTYYREGSYEKAIEIYESLVEEGYLGVSLFYNLGNTYYRVGKIGYSILYYEKALKLDPSDDDIKHNLDFAYLSTIDRIQPLPRFFLFDWWEGLLGLFSANGWAYLVFFSYLAMLTFIGAYFLSRTIKQQKIFFFSGLGTLLLLAIIISLLVVKINRDATLISGVIVEQVVTVKFSPDLQSTDSFIIHEGLKVNLEDKLDEWVKIRLADGKVGWIQNNYVMRI